MPERPTVVYLYDGTFDGLLTSVFQAYSNRISVECITGSDYIQTGFSQMIEYVETDEGKARRVERGILNKIGGMALYLISTIFWSGDPEKDTIIYRYIRAGFGLGRKLYDNLTHPDVLAANNLYRNISREEQRVKGFVRFSQMENGVYYGKIAPKNSLVPLMMPHFADRFNDMPFLLHDTAHNLVGLYDTNSWELVESPNIALPDVTVEEKQYRKMWKMFYDAIAVQGRINPKLRRNMMPKFYWKNMPELDPRDLYEQIERSYHKNYVTESEALNHGNQALSLGQKQL